VQSEKTGKNKIKYAESYYGTEIKNKRGQLETMLVKNSAGISVSILNDAPNSSPSSFNSSPNPAKAPPLTRSTLTRRNAYSYSRKSSYASSHCSESSSHSSLSETLDSPAFSPGLRPTPLLRFDSTSTESTSSLSSSRQSVNTPSPTSPTYQLDPMDQGKVFPINPNDPYYQRNPNGPYFTTAQQPLPSSQSPAMFAPLDSPQAFGLSDAYGVMPLQPTGAVQFAPYATDLIPTPPLNINAQQASAAPVTATSPSDTSNNSGPKTAKKKYPCPHAAKYNCSDTFTTSGHAARHGKKHTGEKNIHCPVCDKAFTRKDNMKQHERTHRNKGEASKVAEAVESSKRAKTLSKESTQSSNEMDVDGSEDSHPIDPQATIRARQQQRRPVLAEAQPAFQPVMSPHVADIPMPVTLDSNETLQQVAPSLQVEHLDKSFSSFLDSNLSSRSQENILTRPPFFERTTSTGSGFGSADGEGESPGLDALAMAAELR
jgi:hypothetical protein